MKHFRYIFALALAFVLVTAFAASAPADTFGGQSGTSNVEIPVDYQAPTDNRTAIEQGADSTRVYSMTVDWQRQGTIVYNAGDTTYVWNDDTLQYDGTTANQGWTVEGAKVAFSVKNRSNRPIDVDFSAPKAINGVTLTGSYDNAKLELKSAAPTEFFGTGSEQSGNATYTVNTVDGDITGDTKTIATITVTITGR